MGKFPITLATSSNRKGLRLLAALSAGLLLGSCAMNPGSDFAALYQITKAEFEPPQSVTLEEAAAVPYASIGVRLGDSNQFLLVLATNEDSRQLWTSASRISILTRDGRIVRTGGLAHNLGSLQSLRILSENGTTSVRWTADFPELSLYAIPIVCVRMPKGDEVISILGKDMRTRRVEEHCQAETDRAGWRFTNVFWQDPETGFIWKSVQHVNPKLNPLEIAVLRPPA